MRLLARLCCLPACLLLGAVAGLSSVALHQRWWGLLLGVAATVATTVALPPGWWARLPFGVGWAGMVGYLMIPRDEGDYVVTEGPAGYALLALALGLIVAVLVTMPRRSAGTGPAAT